jgi:hypothetical protein
VYYELSGLQEILYSSIQMYAKEVAGTGVVYDAAVYPYWLMPMAMDSRIRKTEPP